MYVLHAYIKIHTAQKNSTEVALVPTIFHQ